MVSVRMSNFSISIPRCRNVLTSSIATYSLPSSCSDILLELQKNQMQNSHLGKAEYVLDNNV